MSTAVKSLFQESTIDSYPSEKNNKFLYGKPGTDISSIENPEIKPRSSRNFNIVNAYSNKIEIIKQLWNGTVIDCNDQELIARLEDLTNPSNPDEFVTLSIEEIDDKEQPLIQKGAMFMWHIGYRQGSNYPKERFSKIRFRRLPKWSFREIQEAEKLAKEYTNFFLTDSSSTA